MEGENPNKPSCSRQESRRHESKSINGGERLLADMVCDPWPVTKSEAKKDTILEAAQLLVRARNTELVNECSNAITLLPASDAVSGLQGGSSERPLYSLRSPKVEPFKVHLWQTPAVRTWNRNSLSWNVTPGKIMVRRGVKSEPLMHLLKTLGVAKGDAKASTSDVGGLLVLARGGSMSILNNCVERSTKDGGLSMVFGFWNFLLS